MNPMTLRPLLLTLVSLALAGCARQDDIDDTASLDSPAASADQAQAPAPPPVVNGVVVDVSLSPDAQARLEDLSEKILVEANFIGDPSDQAESQVNALGMIELGSAREELSGAGQVSFPESLIDSSRLGLIVGQPQVTINVLSARTVVPDNLLACTFYWETLSEAGAGPIEIPCTLAGPAEQD